MSPASPPEPVGVLYVIGTFRFGGSERQLLEIVRRLDRRRFRPCIAVLQRHGELERSFVESNAPIHVVGIRRLLSVSTPRKLRELESFADRNHVGIVHGFHFHANLYAALLVGRRSGRILLASERGIVQEVRRRQQWLMRFYHGRARRVISNSDAVKRSIEKIPGARIDRLVSIPNGVDTDRFDPERVAPLDRTALGLPPGGVLVGHVGRFREEKGQIFMLDAFREVALKDARARFLLVGGGPDSSIVRTAADQPPLAGRTVVLDYCEDVRPMLRTMDIFVLPSRTEGMPNALLEAMAMRLACVSTRVGGTPELLDQGAAGCLVEYGDRKELVDHILELIESEEKRTRYARQARRRAVERFSMEKMISAHERIYEEEMRSSAAVVRAGARRTA